jgi:hypothetical protein
MWHNNHLNAPSSGGADIVLGRDKKEPKTNDIGPAPQGDAFS